ncbi:MAG: hypothetical protein KTR26_05875 [Flammeovirgaceae bacterium]|nr:hypothetical protein [Flammeovirgaceae bacterium]
MKSYTGNELKQRLKRKTHIIESGLEDKKFTLKEIGEIIPGNLVLNDLQMKQNLYVN